MISSFCLLFSIESYRNHLYHPDDPFLDAPGVVFHGNILPNPTPEFKLWLGKRYDILLQIQELAKMSTIGLETGDNPSKTLDNIRKHLWNETGKKEFKVNQYMVSILIN